MTNYNWTDNPTQADVSVYNPDVLNECLMHLKYDNNHIPSTRFCFNSGNTNSYGNADLIEASLSTNIKYATPGAYVFTAPSDAYYEVVMAGGGGSSASGCTLYSTVSYAGGGSGAVFVGEVFLTAGEHYVTVGSAGGNNNTSLDNLIIAGGGGNATLTNFNALCTNQRGGSVSINAAVQNVSVNSNGNAGGFSNGNIAQYGGASVYYNYGKGADSGCGSEATCGYFSVKLNSYDKNISYKIGGNYPSLTGTLTSGEKFVLDGLNSDDADLLSNGVYHKFVGADGSSELLKNQIFKQSISPNANVNDVWLNTSCEPVTTLKWNGSDWVRYDKIPLGQITISNNSITAVSTFPYNQNGYDFNSKSPLAKPSGIYTDLILPASSGYITAPYNGVIQLASNSANYMQLYNSSRNGYLAALPALQNNDRQSMCLSIPCQKGDQIQIFYTMDSLRWFRCYADEGSF